MNKKIVHINTFTSGGAAKACLRISNALNNIGCNSNTLVLYKGSNRDNHVFDFRDNLSVGKKLLYKVKNKLFEAKFNQKFGNSNELFTSYQSVWHTWSNELVKNADVIHLHWISRFVDFELLFEKINNKKIVFTLHDYFPFSGGYHYPNQCFSTQKFAKQIESNQLLLKKIFKNVNVNVVGPSMYILNQAKLSGVFTNAIFTHIPNPVNCQIFSGNSGNFRKEHGLSDDDKVILFINDNKNYKRKGFHCFKLICKDLIAKGYKIIIAGDSDKDLNDKNIIQVGYINDESKLSAIYGSANCLVFTSQDDNLPNTIAEALVCGLPVVAFAVGGVVEMINQANGFLVEKNNLNQLIDKIDICLSKDWKKTYIAQQASMFYNEDTIAKAYLKVYNA